MNGKGDAPRQVDGEKYRENYDAIFRKPHWDGNPPPHLFFADWENPVFDGPKPKKRPRENLWK